jgi:hypothetical protein
LALVPKLKAALTAFAYGFFHLIPFENEFSTSLNKKKPDTKVSGFSFVGPTGLFHDPLSPKVRMKAHPLKGFGPFHLTLIQASLIRIKQKSPTLSC